MSYSLRMQLMDSLVIKSQRRGLAIDREVVSAPRGMIGLSQNLNVEKDSTNTLVTGDGVILTYVEIKKGSFFIGDQEMPSRFLLYIPKYSLVNIHFSPCRIFSLGVVSKKKIFKDINVPVLINVNEKITSICSLLKISLPEKHLSFDPDLDVSPIIKESRQYLLTRLTCHNPVSKASEQHGVNSYEISKKFKAAYKISPKSYVNRVRLFDAVFFLLNGKDIITTALDSGFGDLKRFYSQFARSLGSTPGVYKAKGKKRQEISF